MLHNWRNLNKHRHPEGAPFKKVVIQRECQKAFPKDPVRGQMPWVLAITLITLTLAAIAAVVIYRTPNTNAVVGMRQSGAGPKSHAGFPSRQPAAITNGLVGWWKLDGDATDSTGNGHDGTVTGGTYAAGKFSNSLSLSGTSQSAEIPYDAALAPTAAASFSVWARQDGLASVRTIASLGNYSTKNVWELTTNSADYYSLKLCIATSDNDNCANFAVTPTGTSWLASFWHHVVFTYDGTGPTDADKLKLYIDGQLQTLTFTGTIPSALLAGSSSSHFLLGDWYGYLSGTKAWNGDLDDARFYNRELTAEEVSRLYAGSSPPPCDQTCIGYWKLDETSGTNAADSSGHGFNGTLTNFLFTNDGWKRYSTYAGSLLFERHNASYVATSSDAVFDATATPLTVTGWVNRTDRYSGGFVRKTGSGGWRIGYTGSSSSAPLKFESLRSNGNVAVDLTTAVSIPTLTWAHFAFVFKIDTTTLDNNTVVAYINGRQDTATATRLYTPAASLSTLDLGFGYASFSGPMDDIRVYNRALSSAEIYNLYAAGR